LPQRTVNWARRSPSSPAGASPASVSEWTVTRRGARSTVSPARAASCNRRPSTRTAEYMGGTWSISPVSGASAARTAASVSAEGSPRSTTVPSASSVVVAAPKATVAR
jgi:hypothetical protein